MKLAVLLYGDTENPKNIPILWPAEARQVSDDEHVAYPWLSMTPEQYKQYCEEHQAEYDAWEYQDDLAKLKGAKIELLWQSAYDYNFQFFSGGAYAQILEMKLGGVQRAIQTQGWIFALWTDYYTRKYMVGAAMTTEAVEAVSLDFSNNGNPPWTVPEMLAEAMG